MSSTMSEHRSERQRAGHGSERTANFAMSARAKSEVDQ
jgi:hypothetical protein